MSVDEGHGAWHAVLSGAQTRIARGPYGPAAARAIVTRWLDGQVSGTVQEHACMVISELVTNSLMHADAAPGSPVRIRAVLTPGVLRLEVGDDGRGGEIARRGPDFEHGGGFGLHLVSNLAARWGVEHADGTEVWCELPCEPLPC
jgi:two-component sensor histidine kinase